MFRKRVLLLGSTLLALAVLGTGCISYSTLHTAKPVKEGATQITLSPNFYGLSASDGDNSISGDIPTIEIAGRYGINEDMDFGAKLFLVGAGFDFNYAVVNTPDFVLSLDPYVSVTRLTASGDTQDEQGNTVSEDASLTYGVALLNVLADVVTSDIATVTVGLKPGFLYAIGSSDSVSADTGFVVGGMAGVTFHVSESFSLMPSVDVLMPVENFGDTIFYTGSLGVNF